MVKAGSGRQLQPLFERRHENVWTSQEKPEKEEVGRRARKRQISKRNTVEESDKTGQVIRTDQGTKR
jgi:hypothetical protein